jgi:hypothetical protein
MAGKDISVKKYVVRLSAEEREQLQALARKGKAPARRLLRVAERTCALDAAAVGEQGCGTRHRRSRERLNDPSHA